MDRTLASQLRQKLGDLRSERARIEEELLDSPQLMRGALLERRILAGGKVRGTPAYYVCLRREDGRNQFIYVRQADLERIRTLTDRYRAYRRGLSRLRALSKEILKGLDALSEQLEVR